MNKTNTIKEFTVMTLAIIVSMKDMVSNKPKVKKRIIDGKVQTIIEPRYRVVK